MYKKVFRPLLFLLSPERVHHLIVSLILFSFRIPGVRRIVRSIFSVNHPSLQKEFLGLKFNSPVGLAAGFDKNARFYNEFSDLGFSHIELGTVTPEAQPGNPKPRSFRLPLDMALINRMGFNNRGVDRMLKQLQKKRKKGLIIGGNIGKNTATENEHAVADYERCFETLYGHVDYFVVNVSCPNISDLHELQDQDGLEAILGSLSSIRKQQEKYTPILLKISPDLNQKQIDVSLAIVQKHGIDGIVATNTSVSRVGLKTSKERIEEIANGGLSGAPLTLRSIEIVKYISQKTQGNLPIIGVGGIMTVQNALDMLNAGATLIQVYSGFIYEGPFLMKRINKALLKQQNQL